MDAVEVRLDGNVFSADVAIRAAHRYTADFYVGVASDAGDFVVRLTPMSGDINCDKLEQRFHNDALDEQLRERIRTETHELQTTLVSAALEQARGQTQNPSE